MNAHSEDIHIATEQLHTYCAMCTSRCGVLATVEDGVLKQVHADPDHPNGCICVKGAAAPEIVYSRERLRAPLLRTRPKGDPDPGWAEISWVSKSTQITASWLGRACQKRQRLVSYSPEACAFISKKAASSESLSPVTCCAHRLGTWHSARRNKLWGRG